MEKIAFELEGTWEDFKKNLILCVRSQHPGDINIPKHNFLDMEVFVGIKVGEKGMGPVTKQIMKTIINYYCITETEVYSAARENSQSKLMIVDPLKYIKTEVPMPFIPMKAVRSGEAFGASAILFPEIFESLAEQWDTDVMILPSSVHELITVPDFEGLIPNEDSLIELQQMVKRINRTVIREEDVLTDSIYRYVRGLNIVEQII